MKKPNKLSKNSYGLVLAACFAATTTAVAEGTVAMLLQQYQALGASSFDVGRGQALWNSNHIDQRSGQKRACTSCHTSDLRRPGKHARTGKVIEPMAPSANLKRLTDIRKIGKWFKRNCKWTLGRECTPQEKGDILSYLTSQ